MTKPVLPMRIYVAGPYTHGDQAVNARNAIFAGNACRLYGHVPFIPHLTMFWHMIAPHDYQFWMDYDLEWLSICDAVLRLPGESEGADVEVAWALEHGLKVYYNVLDVPRVTCQPPV